MTDNFAPIIARRASLLQKQENGHGLTIAEHAELDRLTSLLREQPTNPGRRLPSTNSLSVYREALTLTMARFEAMNLDSEGLEAFHEAKELATVIDGWEDLTKLRMRGVQVSEPDADDKTTVYRRVWAVRDALEAAERRLRDRLPVT